MIVLGLILLAIGIGALLGYRLFPTNQTLIIVVFALAALILFLVLAGNVKENVGMIVASLWLLLMGIMAQFGIKFTYSDLILAVLPIGAGGFLLLGL
jgi:hypothetical protein